MTLIEKISTLTDAELKVLLSNARRLDVTGSPAQRREVAQVITPLEREASRRRSLGSKRPMPLKSVLRST